ncbi:unnamed protein product, partial [Prorocentrum cordatum]
KGRFVHRRALGGRRDGMSACGTLGHFPFPGVRCCDGAPACAEACSQAEDSDSCAGVLCDAALTRCACPGGLALSVSGGCVAAPERPQEPCEPGYTAEFNVAVYASPELHGGHFAAGPSAPLEGVLRWAVGAGVGCNASDVSIGSATLAPATIRRRARGGRPACRGLAFSFCPPAPLQALESPVARAAFEARFVAAAQRFASLAPATFSLVRLEATLQPNASEALLATQAEEVAEGGGRSVVAELVLLASLVVVLVAVSVVALNLCVRRGRKVQDDPAELPLDGYEGIEPLAALEGGSGVALTLRDAGSGELVLAQAGEVAAPGEGGPAQGEQLVMARVAYDFSPRDVETSKLFRNACLQVREGDVVEVVAGGGGWFYGRVVGGEEPQRSGFFPESYCSWISAVAAGGQQVPSPERHLLVSVTHRFAPEEVKERSTFRDEDCLAVAEGEVVEVLAGGAGWLFGRVAGQPERVGYVPEDRTVWLGRPAEDGEAAEPTAAEATAAEATAAEAAAAADGAALHSTGFFAQVRTAFSPGTPGDSVEEAVDPFTDSCIAIAEGDVVEVLAAGGGWLYGRLVGNPAHAGYFPEARVAWMGKPGQEQAGDHRGERPRELWHCPACDEPNGAARAACNNCGRGRAHEPQDRWACPACGEPNRGDRPLCNNCKRPRPGTAAAWDA